MQHLKRKWSDQSSPPLADGRDQSDQGDCQIDKQESTGASVSMLSSTSSTTSRSRHETTLKSSVSRVARDARDDYDGHSDSGALIPSPLPDVSNDSEHEQTMGHVDIISQMAIVAAPIVDPVDPTDVEYSENSSSISLSPFVDDDCSGCKHVGSCSTCGKEIRMRKATMKFIAKCWCGGGSILKPPPPPPRTEF